MSSVLHNCSDCNPVVFPPLTGERNVQRKQKFPEKQEFLETIVLYTGGRGIPPWITVTTVMQVERKHLETLQVNT